MGYEDDGLWASPERPHWERRRMTEDRMTEICTSLTNRELIASVRGDYESVEYYKTHKYKLGKTRNEGDRISGRVCKKVLKARGYCISGSGKSVKITKCRK